MKQDMELSLHLSFELKHSLGGYTVGTTIGFRVMTVELWPHGLTTESNDGTRSNI
jgi:hypothetical protein